MSEAQNQAMLAGWLDAAGVLWFHPPNEGRRSPRTGARLKAAGMRRGVPDCIICTPPPAAPHVRGVAIELKALKGRLSPEQDLFLRNLRSCEWLTHVAYGFDDAVRYLESLGYQRAGGTSS